MLLLLFDYVIIFKSPNWWFSFRATTIIQQEGECILQGECSRKIMFSIKHIRLPLAAVLLRTTNASLVLVLLGGGGGGGGSKKM